MRWVQALLVPMCAQYFFHITTWAGTLHAAPSPHCLWHQNIGSPIPCWNTYTSSPALEPGISISIVTWVCCSLLMASNFRCHPDCLRAFASQRGLMQHQSTCQVYAHVQAEWFAWADTTFLFMEEPLNKWARPGADVPQVRVLKFFQCMHLTWILGHYTNDSLNYWDLCLGNQGETLIIEIFLQLKPILLSGDFESLPTCHCPWGSCPPATYT